MASGIYAVANFGTIRLYVGEVKHLKTRWPKMLEQLERGTFPESTIQAEWSVHKGNRRFTFHTPDEIKADNQLRGRRLFIKDSEKTKQHQE
ncbi:MAG: hypothetical protein F6K00_17045 [Leptolyngbya sp. SIOISBB]|nr:hypothetical protein [Leptolyngbya sp. SIOISBB]